MMMSLPCIIRTRWCPRAYAQHSDEPRNGHLKLLLAQTICAQVKGGALACHQPAEELKNWWRVDFSKHTPPPTQSKHKRASDITLGKRQEWRRGSNTSKEQVLLRSKNITVPLSLPVEIMAMLPAVIEERSECSNGQWDGRCVFSAASSEF
jgi:hypothetical protein